MTYTSPYRFTPGLTPAVIKYLIITTCAVSIFAALTNNLFTSIFQAPGPQDWLSLSWYGLKHLYIWQFVSYLFLQYSGFGGITFSFLINLTLSMYFLWILGSIIHERVGDGPFLRLYLLSGVFAGLAALLVMPITGYSALAGPAPALLALLVVWTMLHPGAEILLFFLIPIQAKWLALGVLGAVLLVSLAQLDLGYAVFYFSGALFGYLYALLAWNLEGPFPATHPFDHAIARIGIKVRHRLNKWRNKKEENSKKIIQFPLNDDQFVDAMLSKISRYGENSLSWSERRRMDEIARKKSRN